MWVHRGSRASYLVEKHKGKMWSLFGVWFSDIFFFQRFVDFLFPMPGDDVPWHSQCDQIYIYYVLA